MGKRSDIFFGDFMPEKDKSPEMRLHPEWAEKTAHMKLHGYIAGESGYKSPFEDLEVVFAGTIRNYEWGKHSAYNNPEFRKYCNENIGDETKGMTDFVRKAKGDMVQGQVAREHAVMAQRDALICPAKVAQITISRVFGELSCSRSSAHAAYAGSSGSP